MSCLNNKWTRLCTCQLPTARIPILFELFTPATTESRATAGVTRETNGEDDSFRDGIRIACRRRQDVLLSWLWKGSVPREVECAHGSDREREADACPHMPVTDQEHGQEIAAGDGNHSQGYVHEGE